MTDDGDVQELWDMLPYSVIVNLSFAIFKVLKKPVNTKISNKMAKIFMIECRLIYAVFSTDVTLFMNSSVMWSRV